MTRDQDALIEPQQVRVFLDKIARDRDRELQNIEAQRRDKIVRLRREAFAESRRIHHQASKKARDDQSRKHDRYVATINAKLRRRHWRLLTDLQQRVVDSVWTRMMEAWNDPSTQWRWCRAWVNEARRHSGSDPVHISLGQGGHCDVCNKIERMMADYPGEWNMTIDESSPAGIVIRWAQHLLDGSLRIQQPELQERAMRRITQIVYRETTAR